MEQWMDMALYGQAGGYYPSFMPTYNYAQAAAGQTYFGNPLPMAPAEVPVDPSYFDGTRYMVSKNTCPFPGLVASHKTKATQ